MNIAMVNRSLGMRRGGGEIWDLEMARALQSKGVDVTIYTGKPLTQDLDKPVDLPLKKVPSPFLYDLGYAAPTGIGGVISDIDRSLFSVQLLRHLGNHHDIVHVNGYPELLRLKSHVDVPMTIKLNGPPHSLFYDYIHPWKSSYSWLERADAVITTGVTTQIVRERTNVDPVTINPGVDTERFSPDGPAVETSGPTVLWVGRFVPAKNLRDLVTGFANILETHPNAELWLVGNGPLRERVGSYVDGLGIEDAVTFWGYVSNKELPPYYRAADVFALSSKTENHPIALMEAMSCSVPVVAPRIGWIPELVTDGCNGYLISPNDPVAIKEGLIDCLEANNRITQNARSTAVSNFSWEKRAIQLQSIFEETTE